MKILENTIIKNYSNMRVGGTAKRLILIEDINEIKNIFEKYNDIFVLGNGTNVLFGDNFIDKTFICMKNLNKIEYLGENKLKIEAGATIKDMLDAMSKYNLTGLESLVGIPGTIGGLIYMNGGAFGSEIFDNIESVELLNEDLEIVSIPKKDIKHSYRYSELQDRNVVVLSATFKFENGYNADRVKEIKEQRESKHPLDKPSLGSTFKNPDGDFAARLISECGLKGYTVGGATVAHKHPNFVLNLGNATCQDIEQLLEIVKSRVKEKFNIELYEEIIKVK